MMGKEKKKSEKQLPLTDKESNNRVSFPDLPQQLIHLIARKASIPIIAGKSSRIDLIERKSTLLDHICAKGVTKSWRTEPSKCKSNPAAPWLELSSNYGSEKEKSQIFNIPIKKGYMWYWGKCKPEPPSCHFIGFSRGLIMAKGESDSDYSLLNPLSDGYWNIPLWDAEFPIILAALSSPCPFTNHQEHNCTVMVLTGGTHPAFAYYRIWEGVEWIKKDSTIVDPNCSDPNRRDHLLQFTNGIWCNETFYALSLQGTLAVIEDIDFDLRITALCKQRAVPSVSCKHFREFLVESEGKILLALLISRNSINRIDYVEVYELNTHILTWIKKESLDDRTLFLGADCCMCVSASRVGCRGNCIYFSHQRSEGWWVYAMETATISSLNNISPLWVEPIEVE